MPHNNPPLTLARRLCAICGAVALLGNMVPSVAAETPRAVTSDVAQGDVASGAASAAPPATSSAGGTLSAEPVPWIAAPPSGHALIGRLWSARPRAGGGFSSIGAPIRQDSIALVGEVHDNGVHHAARAAWLGAMVRDGARPAAVFEQFSTDRQPAIDAFLARPAAERTPEAFLAAVDWKNGGWAKYDYWPLLEAVVKAGLPIYAGDPPRNLMRRATKEGAAAISEAELKRLALDAPLPPALHDASLAELERSHCGAMPKTALDGLAFAQRLRDATIADVALRAFERHGTAVIFTGNGHVRADRGVPWYIRKRAPSVPVGTTLLVEVDEARQGADAYVPRTPEGSPAAGGILFTPRVDRPDPCEAFKARMQKPAAPAK